MMCYENNKPIVLPKNVKYEIVDLVVVQSVTEWTLKQD